MIAIVPYRPDWPHRFDDLERLIRQCMGALAERVDHIGSTSVPGLAAKDVIDVQVTVRSFPASLEERLTAAGFRHVAAITHDHVPPGAVALPQEWEKRMFALGDSPRRANLHVRIRGRANQRYALLFRDYLRARPDAAATYAQIKHALAKHVGHDVDAYYDVKDPACDLIMQAADMWAIGTGWVERQE